MISDATINIEPAVIELDLGHPRQNVRFGSKADMCDAKSHIRFTPKADMCDAKTNVRFVPKADIVQCFY